jgi:epoxyqueuosine reductase
MLTIPYQDLCARARSIGLDVMAVFSPISMLSDIKRLSDWQDLGFSGELHYMQKPAALFGNTNHILEEARSVISFRVTYSTPPVLERSVGYGRIARYALGKDYHRVIRKRLKTLMQGLEKDYPGLRQRAFSDSVPLLERAIAREAEIGFQGKNTMIIRKGEGSFFFLAEVVTSAVISDTPPKVGKNQSCGTCSRCISACPTNALVSEYSLDARRCISYLTIEKKGSLSLWEQRALGEWVFGCDICQEVCPFNHGLLSINGSRKKLRGGHWPEFSPRNDTPGFISFDSIFSLRHEADFLASHAGTPLMRAGFTGMIRNTAAVIANQGETMWTDALLAHARDHSSVVRHACLSAIYRLGANVGHSSFKFAKELIASDDSYEVREILTNKSWQQL